jgi:transketolase
VLMRATFSSLLTQLAVSDPKVLLLTGDHGYALFDEFRKACPSQYINAGIAEQNMVGMAAGLAKMGYKPFVYGLSAFVPVRVVEQIKIDIAHDGLPVTLIGDGAGFVYSHLGTSHQSTEDIACTRSIPNLVVMSPADRFELEACMMLAYQSGCSTYLRMGKADLGDVHPGRISDEVIKSPLSITKSNISVGVGNRNDQDRSVVIFASGSMVKTAIFLANERYPNSNVYSLAILKPLDEESVRSLCSESKAIIVMEEHSIIGGVSSAILEACSAIGCPPLLRIGVADRFSRFCGSYDYLIQEHGLSADLVGKKIDRFLDKVENL